MAELGSNSKWRNPTLIAAGCMTLLAASFHLQFLLGVGGFWRDEVNLINLASRSPLQDVTKDSFPALMPLLVRGWCHISSCTDDTALRFLGVVVGLGLLGTLWVSARSMNRLPPLAGLALFGLNSTVIAQGDSLRAYGLGSLLIVLAATMMWAFLEKPTLARAAGAGVAAVLSVQTLYQNSVLVGAICLGGWAVCWRRHSWRQAAGILCIGATSAVSLAPYVPNLLIVRESAAALRTGFSPAGIFGNFGKAAGFPLPQYVWVWAMLAVVVIASGFASLRHRDRLTTGSDLRIFTATTLCGSLLAFCGFLWIAALPTQPWYFLPIMAIAAICIHAGLPPVPKPLRAPLFGAVLATACVSVPYARQDLSRRFTNVDLLARRLNADAAAKDFVIVSQWYCGLTFERYFDGRTPWSTLPPLADHLTHRYDLVQTQLRARDPIQPVLDQVATTLQEGNRVWVVGRMYIPLRGTPGPAALPPAPPNASGVSASPYIKVWNAELAHFLNEHSRRFELIEIPPTNWINPNEDMQLFVASGWQTDP